MRPRFFFYLLALAMVALVTREATALGKGEFYRQVPGWWVRPALCVHSHEGSWRDADSGRSGHYGGLQMDLGFMRRYGGWILKHHGTADRWPVRTQLLVAWRGYKVRGWSPWPNTARACGLL